MFTGIITDIGTVTDAREDGLRIACHYPANGIAIGASIACDGCCLTVTGVEPSAEGAVFSADLSNETKARTTFGVVSPGRRINLERPLTLKDELGGHIVTGHIDGRATVRDALPDGVGMRYSLACPEPLRRYVAIKGSVALDGVSLTVAEIDETGFGVVLIPHTLQATTWSERERGDQLNLEVDLFARYIERLSGRS